ncbi:MAG: hypothetical protein JWR89_4706 [Tardiphaga sp.]|nr:hypothetical protein [Tardiphaga sp.]
MPAAAQDFLAGVVSIDVTMTQTAAKAASPASMASLTEFGAPAPSTGLWQPVVPVGPMTGSENLRSHDMNAPPERNLRPNSSQVRSFRSGAGWLRRLAILGYAYGEKGTPDLAGMCANASHCATERRRSPYRSSATCYHSPEAFVVFLGPGAFSRSCVHGVHAGGLRLLKRRQGRRVGRIADYFCHHKTTPLALEGALLGAISVGLAGHHVHSGTAENAAGTLDGG